MAPLILFLTAASAFAQIPPIIDPSGEVCSAYPGFAYKVVTCIRDTVIEAVRLFLVPFSEYMANTIIVAMTLAVVLYGTLLTVGRISAPRRDGFTLAIKIGCVALFAYNLGGFFPLLLWALDDMLDTVTLYMSFGVFLNCSTNLWIRVDCALGEIIGGFGNGTILVSGIIGFLITCLFSGTAGLALFLLGLKFLMLIVTGIAHAAYTFIMSYVAMAVMVCVSPLFVPMVLFRTTRGYFEKWLRLLIGFFLQPIILFAFLAMFLQALEITVFSGPRSVYRVLAGDAVDAAPPDPPFAIGYFLNDLGIYKQEGQGGMVVNMDSRQYASGMAAPETEQTGPLGVVGEWGKREFGNLPWESEGGPVKFLDNLRNNFAVEVPMNVVDFDDFALARGYPSALALIADLLLALLMAAIVAYVFITLLQAIPFLGSSMVGGDMFSLPMLGGGSGGMDSKVQSLNQMLSKDAMRGARGSS